VVTFTNRNHFNILDELAPVNSALVKRSNDLFDF
jgi:hypothetical protein